MKLLSDHQKFIELRSEGYSYRKIVQILGISKDTCVEWNKKFLGEIDSCRRHLLSDLIQKYILSKETQLKLISDTINRINQEIRNQDWKSINLSKLLQHQREYLNLLIYETNGLYNKEIEYQDNEMNNLSLLFNSEIKTDNIKIEIINASDDERIKRIEKQIEEEILNK